MTFRPVRIKKPLLVLDSTGTPPLYRRMFPRHQLEVDPAWCRLQAKVVQICDQSMPLATLKSKQKLKQVQKLVTAIIKQRKPVRGVLVVARRDVLKRMTLPGSVQQIYYGAQRGSRKFEKCHTVILVGAAEPGPEQIAAQAEALLHRPVSRTRRDQERAYAYPSSPGKSYGTQVKVYPHALHQALLERVREGEMTQAAYRIRPLESKPDGMVFVLSSLPLDLLPPDELLPLEELRDRFDQSGSERSGRVH
ncbi:MAG: hypothetical protein HY906_27345 [Deltaproteobacteria bacterium]|nr:hypothetical protein [Deltaproteobacteria bacterium]